MLLGLYFIGTGVIFFFLMIIIFNLDREIFKTPILIRSGGGIQNYLYQLKLSSQGSAQMKVDGSNVLGKLQITWRSNLGEPGRLQTQQILGNVSDQIFFHVVLAHLLQGFTGLLTLSPCIYNIRHGYCMYNVKFY